ncbi:MAG: 2-acyl-glycerophospho-ethanolamine acyltransferase, partial [Firmicutes bacterium]|nr:2-acyl-glycerophospho-ethanolamine acyltransferase [Bacillota bacterium]
FAALWRGNLALMVVMVGAMGLQSALFSPALNGSLPELFPRERLVWVNGILRVGVTLGILAGVASAGMALDLPLPKLGHVPWGRGLVGLGVLSFSLAGWALAWLIPRRGASDPSRPFPWSGPWETLRELRSIGADRPLGRILLLDALLWSMGVFQLLLINALGKEQFGFSDRATSLLVMAQMLGLAVGGLGAAHGAQGKAWLRMLAPSAWLMALGMGLVWLVPQTALALQNPLLFGGVALAGLGGGLLLVPTETFLQARPAPERKGATWAAANFASFSGMTLASGLYILVNRVAPTHAYGGLAALSLAIALWLMVELRHPAWEG